MNNHILIGFVGYKQSGKDTAANALINCFPLAKFPFVKRIGFADGVKDEIAEALGLPVLQIEERKNIPEVRRLLQWWGTEFRRSDNDLYWVNKLASKVSGLPSNAVVIIPDVRFPNEANFIRQRNGLLIRVERKGFDNSQDPHPSEAFISTLPCDYTVSNSQTPLLLTNHIKWLYADLITPHFKL